MSEDLSKDLQDKAKLNDQGQAKKFNFKASASRAFTPGNFGQYGAGNGAGNAASSYAYQDYSNYARPQPTQQFQPAQQAAPKEEPATMTLEEYQNQNKANLNTRVPIAKKVISVGATKKEQPKVVKVGSSASASASVSASASASASASSSAGASSTAPSNAEAADSVKKSPSPAPAATPKAATPSASTSASTPAAKSVSTSKESSAPVETAPTEAEISKLDQDIVEDMYGAEGVKEHMSIIFMGHVDAGKSTMGGNLLFLTGSVDKRTIEKYEREAQDAGRQGWYLSWVMDTNKEERNEGKTIEVGRATFETEKRRYTILDAPGHKMYVPSMIGGASQADAGILVISARRGEYETGFEKGGQTREHAILAKTQGVDRLVVVVNKMDDPTVNWSKERYDECISKLAVFLKAQGFSNVLYMPVSGFTGAGLKERVPKDVCPWYEGPSLLEYLDNLPLESRKINAPFMLPVAAKAKDLGTVVEGKIESGGVKKGQSLLMMPNRTPVEVSAIFSENEVEIQGALCGEQVKLKLKGIEEEDIQIGFVLTSAKNPIRAVTKFEAQVAIVEVKSILTSGYSCVMHVHTAVDEVTFTALLHKLEKGTNRKSRKPPAFAKKGMKVIAVLETAEPVCVEEFTKLPQLGRFTLRDQGQTIAIGKITKILN